MMMIHNSRTSKKRDPILTTNNEAKGKLWMRLIMAMVAHVRALEEQLVKT